MYIPNLIHPTQQLQPPPHTVPNQKPNTNDVQLSLSNPNWLLLKALHSIKKGLPPALLMTTLTSSKTCLPSMNARLIPNSAPNQPYLQTFAQIIQLLLDGNISLTIATSFQLTYVLALHKSATDPLKLYPIGIRTCLHHLMGTI